MHRSTIADSSDPSEFERRNQLHFIYPGLIEAYTQLGYACKVQPRSMKANMIFELSKPFSPIHLVNLGPHKKLNRTWPEFTYPVMLAWIWVNEGSSHRPILPAADRELSVAAGDQQSYRVAVRSATSSPLSKHFPDVFVERQYVSRLSDVLTDDPSESLRRVRAFLDAVVADVKSDLSPRPRGKRAVR